MITHIGRGVKGFFKVNRQYQPIFVFVSKSRSNLKETLYFQPYICLKQAYVMDQKFLRREWILASLGIRANHTSPLFGCYSTCVKQQFREATTRLSIKCQKHWRTNTNTNTEIYCVLRGEPQRKQLVRTSMEPFIQRSRCKNRFCVNGSTETHTNHLLCGSRPQCAAN